VESPPKCVQVVGGTLNNFYNRVHCLEMQDGILWIGLIWLRIGTGGASHEGLSSMSELIGFIV
jgi:hypothetical protein